MPKKFSIKPLSMLFPLPFLLCASAAALSCGLPHNRHSGAARDPVVAVHALVFEKDLLHPIDQYLVFLVFVGPANTVIICGTCYNGDLKQDVQPVFLPQFCYNAYFFFGCRDFLA